MAAPSWQHLPPAHPLYNEKLGVAESPAELERLYESVRSVTPAVVAQEIIQGADTAKLVYLFCYDRNGERVGHCMLRQLRTDPIHFGSASVVEPVDLPAVDALCDTFLRKIRYSGLCELELKQDSRDGQVRLIEANPRYSVTADAAPYTGVDLGWLHYLDLTGHKVAPAKPTRLNIRHISLMRDFAALRSYRKAGLLTWRELLRSYRPPLAFFDFDARDWRVSALTLRSVCASIVRPWLRRRRARTA